MDLLREKRKLLPLGNPQDSGGGGGGSSTQTSTTDLPEWARPYAKDILSKGAALTDTSKNPYQTYGGQRIAGFQPLQEQAMKSAASMDAGPQGFAQNVGSYMSPYMQNVVDVEKREAARQSGIMGTQQQAQATQAGAFGGARDAIQRAERERNLAQQMGDIQTRGSQAAYESAANQFRQGITQGMDVNKLQSVLGQQQQAQAQRPLDVAYQDFLNQQNYPYKQLGFMSDLLRGTPTGSSSVTNMYQPPGSVMGQLGGLGTGIYGLSQMGMKFADGGQVGIQDEEPVIRYAEGGVTSQGNVESIIHKLSDQQLQVALRNAQDRRDVETMQAIQAELAMRASEKQGMASAFNQLPQEQQEETVNAAGGGIIAFADRGAVQDPDELSSSDYQMIRPEAASTLKSIKDFFTPEAARLNREKYESAVAAQQEANKPAPVAPAQKAQPKGAGARSTPDYVAPDQMPKAAPAKDLVKQYADLSGGEKPSKQQIKTAVEQLAEKNDLSKSATNELMDSTKEFFAMLDKQNQPTRDAMNKFVEEQAPDIEGMRKRGIGQALADFGFKWAAAAAKPGARFLESGASAAPALSEAAAKMQELETAAKQNHAKLKMEQMRYEVSLQKGDMQTAATLAGQIRQSQQQDKLLQFHIANAQDQYKLEQQKLAVMQSSAAKQREPETLQLLQYLKSHPEDADLMTKIAGQVHTGLGAAGIRADVASAANLDKALKDVAAKYPLLKIMKPTDPEYAATKAAYDADVRAAYARHGGAGISNAIPTGGSKVMRFDSQGNQIQ